MARIVARLSGLVSYTDGHHGQFAATLDDQGRVSYNAPGSSHTPPPINSSSAITLANVLLDQSAWLTGGNGLFALVGPGVVASPLTGGTGVLPYGWTGTSGSAWERGNLPVHPPVHSTPVGTPLGATNPIAAMNADFTGRVTLDVPQQGFPTWEDFHVLFLSFPQDDGTIIGGFADLTGTTSTRPLPAGNMEGGDTNAVGAYGTSAWTKIVENSDLVASLNSMLATLGVSISNSQLSITPTSSVYGQAVRLAATLSSVAPGAKSPTGGTVPVPTGGVTFYDNGVILGTGVLGATGIASGPGGTTGPAAMSLCNAIFEPIDVGVHTVNVVYSGDTEYTTTSKSTVFTVGPAGTTLVLKAVPASTGARGETGVFKATVSVLPPSTTGIFTGTVQFTDTFNIPGAGIWANPQTIGFPTGLLASPMSAVAGSTGVATTYATWGSTGIGMVVRAQYLGSTHFQPSGATISYDVAK